MDPKSIASLLLVLQVLLARLSITLHQQSNPAVIRRSLATTTAIQSFKSRIEIPEISSIIPSHGAVGTLITIKGRGFATTSNTVYTSYDVLDGLPSPDG